ncbi:hypothetical protein [Rhodovulum adriaticum]|uniref:hypothetical protein n=1 Tax=Rhodovulum adriaticum TaxID=35804 RepID=UPI00104B1CE4|nr:hypothetical protein [Rhodovulum adriaticum]
MNDQICPTDRNGSPPQDTRVEDLSLVQVEMQARHPDLDLGFCAQCHYGPPNFAFLVVYGVDHDTARRRAIRAEATGLLERLGHRVELERGCDVYCLDPRAPEGAHERMEMLRRIRSGLAEADRVSRVQSPKG